MPRYAICPENSLIQKSTMIQIVRILRDIFTPNLYINSIQTYGIIRPGVDPLEQLLAKQPINPNADNCCFPIPDDYYSTSPGFADYIEFFTTHILSNYKNTNPNWWQFPCLNFFSDLTFKSFGLGTLYFPTLSWTDSLKQITRQPSQYFSFWPFENEITPDLAFNENLDERNRFIAQEYVKLYEWDYYMRSMARNKHPECTFRYLDIVEPIIIPEMIPESITCQPPIPEMNSEYIICKPTIIPEMFPESIRRRIKCDEYNPIFHENCYNYVYELLTRGNCEWINTIPALSEDENDWGFA